jgi:hypothetical protein
MLLVRNYDDDVSAVTRHLRWPEVGVRAAANYAEAFRKAIDDAICAAADTHRAPT